MSLTKATYSMISGAVANVFDYGATGDGTTDDTAAIQAAFNSGASCIFIPEGVYIISDTLQVPTRTTVRGASAAVNQYGTVQQTGAILKAAAGALSGSRAVIQAGQASELGNIELHDLVVDIKDAHSTAIGVKKETCNHFVMINIYVAASFGTSTQIAYFNGNGTHGYFQNLNLTGGKYSIYMDNTPGRECHDSVYNKVWMYPAIITGATCMYFPVNAGAAITTWIMPYMETDQSDTVTGIYTADLAAPEMTMILPMWDGGFLWLWNAQYPARSRLIGSNLSTFDPSQFNGPFGRCTIVGREGNQFVEKLYLIDIGGDEQFGVDSSGFNFGRISAGAAKISRIQGGKNTGVVVGSVAAGASFEFNMTVPNGDIGNPIVVGFDWTGTTPIQLTGHMITDSTCRVTLTNQHSGSVDFETREFKAVAINGSMT
jgi:hypothetical protein